MRSTSSGSPCAACAARRESAAPGPSRTRSARSAGAACGTGRRSRSRPASTSTPPVSMRVMSSSSENSPSSASTDALMLLTSSITPASWLRWRSASANRPSACSGWRRSWLAAAKNCVSWLAAAELRLRAVGHLGLLTRRVGRGLLGAQLLHQRLGPDLQPADLVERGAVVAPEQHRHRHRDEHHVAVWTPSAPSCSATRAIAGR